jgi:hypothetical protein
MDPLHATIEEFVAEGYTRISAYELASHFTQKETVMRIALLALIATLFIFGGSWDANASRWRPYCSPEYQQCAKPCQGKNPTATSACLKHCRTKYCQ